MASHTKIEKRKDIIRLHFEKKKSIREIADLLNIGKSTVSYWTIRHKNNENLKDKIGRGRKSKLTESQFIELDKILSKKPKNKRYNGTSFGFTTKMIQNEIKNRFGIEFTNRHIQRICHKLEMSKIKPRDKHENGSDLARVAFKEHYSKKNFLWVKP